MLACDYTDENAYTFFLFVFFHNIEGATISWILALGLGRSFCQIIIGVKNFLSWLLIIIFFFLCVWKSLFIAYLDLSYGISTCVSVWT